MKVNTHESTNSGGVRDRDLLLGCKTKEGPFDANANPSVAR